MIVMLVSLLSTIHLDERGQVSWKWLGLGIVIGAALVILLAVFGLIKFLIPGE